jgi:germination protein M
MPHRKWVGLASVAAAVMLMTSGCSLFGSDGATGAIDPPPAGANLSVPNNALPVMAAATTGSQTEATLYFKDVNGYVAPISTRIPSTPGIAKEVLEYMVDGGPGQALLPDGFHALLPKGTRVKGLNIVTEQKLAQVDFSKEFANYNVQDERKMMEAITWALTSFPTVEKVQIWMEGKVLKEMPVDGTPMDEPLTRTMGINLQASAGTDYGQSIPVTLFFENQTSADYKYFVPVTRMVARTNNIGLAAVSELIKGPNGPGLLSVLDPSTKILSVNDQTKTVTANFGEELLGADQKASPDALKSIVLSLTENTGASQVQIQVNGTSKVIADDKTNYSKPVEKPVHVNEYKM